jgi:hypothetical protein
VSHDDGAPDPQWTPPEAPGAGSPAWMPPGSGPYDPWATPGAPGAPGSPPPGWQPQPPPRKGMPRWAKIVIGVWVVFAVLSLIFQMINLTVLRNR